MVPDNQRGLTEERDDESGNTNDGHPYRITISLNVLNHLGIGLYSNVPAVVSEAVANSWDADAENVWIDLDPTAGFVTIRDDGLGMDQDDLNRKYLNVGYQKRKEGNEGAITPKGRHVMGRKGIGKLSVFSIARIVEVHSVKNEQRNAFRMDREVIRAAIADGGEHRYYPDPIDPDPDLDKGTKIVLSELDRRLAWTTPFLRKRLARRFSIIGSAKDFQVHVDGEALTPADRDFYSKLQFVWAFGPDEKVAEVKNSAHKAEVFHIDSSVGREILPDGTTREYRAHGWIGTVRTPEDIEDESNNAIVVMAYGKLIQENILSEFNEAGVYADYVIGEVNADFMDLDDREDIVTSGRQSIKENDPRYPELKAFILKILRQIKAEWTELRTGVGAQQALENTVIREWYDRLPPMHRKSAEQLFGKIESMRFQDEASRLELYKASLLGFEKLALKGTLDALKHVEDENDLQLLAEVLSGADEVEAAHYYQIVKGRLEIINKFKGLLPDAKEKVLQRYIFDHLWLLNPSWERAATNARIEESVKAEFDNARLTPEEAAGRIDIRYRTAAGKHVIIELKKYDRKVDAVELLQQVRKYRNALEKCLREKYPEQPRVIESICILGSPPSPLERDEENRALLAQVNARYVTYDTLIAEALESYDEYLQREKRVSELVELIERITGPDLAQPAALASAGATAG